MQTNEVIPFIIRIRNEAQASGKNKTFGISTSIYVRMQTSLFIISPKIVFLIEFNGEYFGTNKMLTNRIRIHGMRRKYEEAKDEHQKWEEKIRVLNCTNLRLPEQIDWN